jgi:hypothetical protein
VSEDGDKNGVNAMDVEEPVDFTATPHRRSRRSAPAPSEVVEEAEGPGEVASTVAPRPWPADLRQVDLDRDVFGPLLEAARGLYRPRRNPVEVDLPWTGLEVPGVDLARLFSAEHLSGLNAQGVLPLKPLLEVAYQIGFEAGGRSARGNIDEGLRSLVYVIDTIRDRRPTPVGGDKE